MVQVPGAVGSPTPVRSAALHDGVAREIITRLKFGGERHLAKVAAWLVSTRLRNWAGDAGLLVPMPLSRRRRRERGFNQSLQIARWLSRDWSIPLGRILGRRHSRPQTGLGKRERMLNVAGRYYVRSMPAGGARNVCLVDDVVTTGSSIAAASKVLRKAGVKGVRAVTVTYRGFIAGSMI
jgi:ComF family protein